ncbi:Na+/H+ antiporter subunit E [Alkalibacter rhizosphaerae]|uniref:Na+/H+ antiporter subunit E n=1 Tax=Alkalibacter rhizosphaerae TaxID=2815577 RepID=A0A974XFP4_9FIRM|nr:Na+/H+ antiporter subunit E [Alkalibacter rhizosphaerae]QSX08999.1 Na+/H+ antiporter subunit E [Alkalibacter rhizosphaerae]
MNVFKRYWMLILVFTIMWVILNEKADAGVMLSGVVFSAIALFLTDFFLLEKHYADEYSLKPFILVKYLFFLIFQIYKSGLSAIKIVLHRKYEVHIFDFESDLDDDLAVCLLANSITLTPGTVTANKKDKRLKILAFVAPEMEKMDVSVFQEFEKILRGLRR